jgi:hypothetical protein
LKDIGEIFKAEDGIMEENSCAAILEILEMMMMMDFVEV